MSSVYGKTSDDFFRYLGGWYCPLECGGCEHKDWCKRGEKVDLKMLDTPSMRSAFRARPGWKWVSMDYSAVEMRIPASLSGEPVWIEGFKGQDSGTGMDAHSKTACALFKKEHVDKGSEERKKAKICTFASLYGGSARVIADQARVPLYEAEELLAGWWNALPRLKAWTKKKQAEALSTGFAKTYFGRIRRVTESKEGMYRGKGYAARTTMSHIVSGTAADVMKLSMIKIAHPKYGVVYKNGWQDKVKLLLQVHDELNFEVREEFVDEVVPVLKANMEFKIKEWPVPLTVDCKVGDGWDVK